MAALSYPLAGETVRLADGRTGRIGVVHAREVEVITGALRSVFVDRHLLVATEAPDWAEVGA